jgi:AraC-like DNA-binding protein
MLLLRHMPNIDDTPANAAFRRYFYSKWGKEHCILSGRAARAEYMPFVQRLSIKAAWGGVEQYFIDERRIAVDDDSYLILNDARKYSSLIHSARAVESFSIFFRPGFVEEVLGAAGMSIDRALDDRVPTSLPRVEFHEHLRPHDNTITPVLRYIRHHLDAGFEDEGWYEEQLAFLLERMCKVHNGTVEFIRSLHPVRATTRREIYRRIGLATDFIHGNFHEPLTIDDLAEAAHLSKYHFIRLFESIHGVTPFTYLQTKRAHAARRLLQGTSLSREEVVLQTGFGHRSTMFRQLRRVAAEPAKRAV